MTDTVLRAQLCAVAASLFQRGFTIGSSGNISLRRPDGLILVTPTDSCLGTLAPESLALIDATGRWLDGERPTKETGLHLAMYAQRRDAGAVIHLHATYSVMLSVLATTDPHDVFEPITPYTGMKVGTVPLVPYHPPGSSALVKAVEAKAAEHHAVLMANHGPLVAGKTIQSAQYIIEELEESAKLQVRLMGREYARLPTMLSCESGQFCSDEP